MLMEKVDGYLALRRAAGYALAVPEYHLRNFARFATQREETLICTPTAIEMGQSSAFAQPTRASPSNRASFCPSSASRGPAPRGSSDRGLSASKNTAGCNSHTDTDHCQLRIGTTLSRVVTSAL